MWTRKQLKTKAKESMKRNYWRSVLVGLLILMIGGGAVGGFSAGGSSLQAKYKPKNATFNYSDDNLNFGFGKDGPSFQYNDGDINFSLEDDELIIQDNEGHTAKTDLKTAALTLGFAILLVVIVVSLLVVAIVILMDVFLFNPLEVGAMRFFYKNLNESAEVKEVAYGYDHHYKNVIKVMFFQGLYIFLWSLLFVIPGIIKAYEYRMIPFLLAEHPDMSKEDAFAISKNLMTGEKWNAFVLDLSFILWYLLSAITCGIVAIFYVNPYVLQTNAALYEALKFGKGVPYDARQIPPQTDAYGNPYPNNNMSM